MAFSFKSSYVFLKICLCGGLVLSGSFVYGMKKRQDSHHTEKEQAHKQVIGMLLNLKTDNDAFVDQHARGYFDSFLKEQHPRMTLVTCADSRAHSHALDATPDNDIFMIRNLSGQFDSSQASILYGVNHTHTPLLVVMGHDDCGAVKTKTQLTWLELNGYIQWRSEEKKYSATSKALPTELQYLNSLTDLESAVCEELKHVHLARAAVPFWSNDLPQNDQLERFNTVVHQNIKFNTHRQVDKCLKLFYDQIQGGHLTLMGALYDFQGREKEGRGRLIWIDARDHKNATHFKERYGTELLYNGEIIKDEIRLDDEIGRQDQLLYKPHHSVTIAVEYWQALVKSTRETQEAQLHKSSTSSSTHSI